MKWISGKNRLSEFGLVMLALIFLLILFWGKYSPVGLVLVIVIYLIVVNFCH